MKLISVCDIIFFMLIRNSYISQFKSVIIQKNIFEMGLTFWTFSILLISVAQSTDVKDCLAAKDFEHSIKQIQAENALLREQVKLMKEHDIEADIEEIKNRLDS